MIDEWNNECPYDFKNIMFKRYKVTDITEDGILSELDGKYLGYQTNMMNLSIDDDEDFIWAYTFTYDNEEGDYLDATLYPFDHFGDEEMQSYASRGGITNNAIESAYSTINVDEAWTQRKQVLNDIVFFETFNYTTRPLSDVKIGGDNIHMTFLSGCHSIKTGYDCICFVVGVTCFSNTFGNNCSFNTFGNYCSHSTFGNDCTHNTFGSGCAHSTFGNSCNFNTFGNSCNSNTFGNDCTSNTFGNNCAYNTCSNDCTHNTLLDNIEHTETDKYARWNIFEDGVCYVDLRADEEGSSQHQLQNITIRQGVQGTEGNHKVITETRGLTHDVTYRAANAEDKTI